VARDEDSARKALPVLLEALQDADEGVRYDAARVLGGLLRSGDKEAVAPLGQALRDQSLRVRGQVVQLLGRLGPAAEETVPVLVETLKQKSLRPRVIEVLGRIGPEAKDAVPALIEALREEGPTADIEERIEISPGFGKAAVHESVRLRAVIALGQIGPEARDALPALIDAYGDENEVFRHHVAGAIRAIDPETAKKLGL
jgi:HEAT repeat protein